MIVKGERLVKIKAVDWGYWDESAGYEVHEGQFEPFTGELYGKVVEETDDYIAIAQETFGSKVRKVTSIPKSAIKEVTGFRIRSSVPKRAKKKGRRVK